MKFYNTLTKNKDTLKQKNIKFFVCGITPYDFAHIGHAKTYVQFDFIVKYLRFRGIKVYYLQNVTDIDDKIIKRASEIKITPLKLAREYEKFYMDDMKALKVDSVDKYARATDHIKEIISQVQVLINKGYAYQIVNDGIYFNLSKCKNYGKLSGRKSEEAEDAVSRIDSGDQKINKGDFCLWKKSKKDDPQWKDPWFNGGRPGWHIEDTAITEKHLGQQYDIHGGARDLIFPHHEAEIAQMESASGKKPFVKFWLHTGFLNVKGQKMAKSLGNFITIKDALKDYTPKVLRFFYLSAHYRSPIDFSSDSLSQSQTALERLNEFAKNLHQSKSKDDTALISKTRDTIINALDDDFDTPRALATLFEFVRHVNKYGGGKMSYELLLEFDQIFQVLSVSDKKLSKELANMIKSRDEAREEKNWALADNIRDKLLEKGIIIEDTPQGTRWKTS